MTVLLGVAGLCILTAALTAGATYGFFGHYWHRLRELNKKTKGL